MAVFTTFYTTNLSVFFSKITAGLALFSYVFGAVAIYKLISTQNYHYGVPLISAVVLYFLGNFASMKLNWPIFWTMNYAEGVATHPDLFLDEHIELATLVLVMNQITQKSAAYAIGEQTNKPHENMAHDLCAATCDIFSEEELHRMWWCCAQLLSRYNRISEKVPEFEDQFSQLDLSDELSVLCTRTK